MFFNYKKIDYVTVVVLERKILFDYLFVVIAGLFKLETELERLLNLFSIMLWRLHSENNKTIEINNA